MPSHCRGFIAAPIIRMIRSACPSRGRRGTFRRASAVALAIGVGAAGLVVPPPSLAEAGLPSTDKRWVKVNGNSVTADQARTIATRFDVVVANRFSLVPHVSLMHSVKPDLKILVYLNGTYSRPGEVYPEDLYSHDAAGRRITANSDGGLLMHPGRAAWRNEVGSDCTRRRAQSGYDGCYVDVLGLAPLSLSYGSGLPVRPQTGAVWTATEWLEATAAIGARVKALNPSSYVMVNGLQNGKRYTDVTGASSVLLSGVDGGNAENFIRTAELPVDDARVEHMWKADVDMIVDAESRGQSIFAMTKVWVSATQRQIDRVHEYALASFLLGTSGGSYFGFFSDVDRMNVDEAVTVDKFDSVDVGAPTGAYVRTGNLYLRSFSKGLVIVNPTTSTASIGLPQLYRDVDRVLVGSVTLSPNTARILLAP